MIEDWDTLPIGDEGLRRSNKKHSQCEDIRDDNSWTNDGKSSHADLE